ncbi:YfhO family protein [Metaplanococcus flavidus]|uniref:YfhO family protein n=1 Tax=Metaplanococcus flavidus TaxID=569883 RepID=A0ABW3LD90_9BACL
MTKQKVNSVNILDNKFIKLALTYIFFLLAAFSMHSYFIVSGADFNENCCDSVKQVSHFYPFLQREFLDGNFFWSWSNGLGGDLLGGFSYYYSTSPFFWLTLPFAAAFDSLEGVFDARLIISALKMFLTMVFMFHFLRCLKLFRSSAIIGSLVYGGSVFFMFHSLRYDFMIDGMIYLPLLLWAFEYAIEKKKGWVLIAAVFLVATSNFYLAYINSLYLGVYVLLKYSLMENKSIKGFFSFILRFGLAYASGLLLAAFAFLPAVYSFLNVDRFYYEEAVPAFFDSWFYKNLPYRLLFMNDQPSIFMAAFPALIILLVPLGFLLRDKIFQKRFLFSLLFSLLVLIPFSYSLFNGLSAMQFRWLYLFMFTGAWMSAQIFDMMLKGHFKRHSSFLLAGILLLVTAGVYFKRELTGQVVEDRDLIMLGFMALFTLLLIALIEISGKTVKLLITSAIVLLVLLNGIYMNSFMLKDFLGDAAVLKQHQEEKLASYGTQEEIELIETIKREDDGFYRIMWDHLREQNAPLLLDYKGFSAYSSLMAGNVHRFMKQDYNVLHWNSPSLYQNLDNRLYLETALANKYFIKPKDTWFKPFGFTHQFSTENYEVYQNDYFLPIGYLVDTVVTEEKMETMNFAERDQLLLQAAVVDEGQADNLPEFAVENLTVEERMLLVEDLVMENITIDENNMLIVGDGASLTFKNPWLDQPGEVMMELKIKETSKKRFKVASSYKTFTNNGEGTVYNYPREQIVINLGNQLSNENLRFTLTPGTYEMEELLLTFNPYTSYPEMVNDAKQQSMENITYTGRSVQGTVDAETESMLFLSVPYSKGWQIKVDGVATEALEVNSAFIGVPVSAGEHRVELLYTTPYFKAGLWISVLTLIALLAGYIWIRKGTLNRRRNNRAHYEEKNL